MSAKSDSPVRRSFTIALLPGDGVGKEVLPIGQKLLEAIGAKTGLQFEMHPLDLGADRFLKDGTTFPDSDRDFIRDKCDAVLLGALGDPRVPGLGYARDILFGLRFGFDLYCNLRPIACLHDRLMPLKGRTAKDCDVIVFRENTEGIYASVGGHFKKGTPDEVAINEDINTRKGVERIIRAAFEYAVRHNRKRVHMSDKSNAMQFAHELWLRTFKEVAKEYPSIEAKHIYVDALCMQIVRDPTLFDVVVTCNLFGDIVTDLGAALQGGLGMAASANVQPNGFGLFEPVHGSAPDIAGQGKANPFATVLTVGMMMTHFGYPEIEQKLIGLVHDAIDQNQCTADVGGTLSTTEAGQWIIDRFA